MDIQLIVLDIDGTIAGESNQVSEPVKQAIQAAQTQGIKVALATGRMYQSARRFHTIVESQLPLITYNGALIKDPVTDITYQHLPISQPLSLELLNYLDQPAYVERLKVHCYIDDQLYLREITSDTEQYIQRAGVEPITVSSLKDVVSQAPTTKILAMCEDSQTLDQLMSSLESCYTPDQLHLTQSNAIFFEATNPQATKGFALRYLTEEILGLEPDQVMAIGDNWNDAEMLQYAGLGIAMGNSPPALQKLAHWVAPDVEQDGVAVTINKLLETM